MTATHEKGLILTDYAKKLIRFKSRQLCRRRDFRFDEPEDVQQELWMALLKAIEQFDPNKASLNTFIDRVVYSAVAMLVRTRQRREEQKNGIGTDSLDDLAVVGSDQPQSKGELVTDNDLHRRTGKWPRDERQHRENCEAITRALSAMPNAQRRLCRRLMTSSVQSLSRQLGISRRQVRNRIAANRPYFEQFGLGWE